MKKFFILMCMVISAMHLYAQGYHITGNVSGVDNGKKLYLTLVKPYHTNIDSTYIKDGHFEFMGGHIDYPKWALIKIEKQFVPLADFYLEDGEINISGERYKAFATGTPANEQYRIFNDSINSMGNVAYGMKVTILNTKDQAVKDSVQKALNNLTAECIAREKKFIKTYPDSPVSLRIADYLSSELKSKDILRVVSWLSPRLQQTSKAQAMVELAKSMALTEDNAFAPVFNLPDDKGKMVSIEDYRGNYLLIDFWASWCQPCRASFPFVANLYEEFKDRGFAILGVSLDRDEKAWRKAVAAENCPWTQVWDQKGEVAHLYAIKAIPMFLLVDPEGRVHGRYMKEQIEDVLKLIYK